MTGRNYGKKTELTKEKREILFYRILWGEKFLLFCVLFLFSIYLLDYFYVVFFLELSVFTIVYFLIKAYLLIYDLSLFTYLFPY